MNTTLAIEEMNRWMTEQMQRWSIIESTDAFKLLTRIRVLFGNLPKLAEILPGLKMDDKGCYYIDTASGFTGFVSWDQTKPTYPAYPDCSKMDIRREPYCYDYRHYSTTWLSYDGPTHLVETPLRKLHEYTEEELFQLSISSTEEETGILFFVLCKEFNMKSFNMNIRSLELFEGLCEKHL